MTGSGNSNQKRKVLSNRIQVVVFIIDDCGFNPTLLEDSRQPYIGVSEHR